MIDTRVMYTLYQFKTPIAQVRVDMCKAVLQQYMYLSHSLLYGFVIQKN